MKRIFTKLAVFLTALCLVVSMFSIHAFAAGTTLAFNKSSLNVGDKLTVTMRFSTSEAMYSFEAYLGYDSTILRFESGDFSNLDSPGKVHIVGTPGGSKNITAELTFTTLAPGSSTVSVYGVQYVGEVLQKAEGSAAAVTVKDKSASANADLKSLWISAGSLEPAFSAGTTTYSITIPNETTVLTVSADTADPDAKVTVIGSKEMKVGANKRVIQVTAPNGTVKNYTLNITRQSAEGDTPVEPDDGQPLKVNAGGTDRFIAQTFPLDDLPEGYEVGSFDYNGIEVPIIEKDGRKAVYLTEENGENGVFYFLADDGNFTPFVYVKTPVNTYVFLDPAEAEVPDGYSEIEMNIGDLTVTAFRSEDPALSDFVLIYAQGPDGYTGFYRYDTVEQTFQKAVGLALTYTPAEEEPAASSDLLDNVMNLSTESKIVAVTILAVILLLIIAIIVLIVKIVKAGRANRQETGDNNPSDLTGFDFITDTDRDEK